MIGSIDELKWSVPRNWVMIPILIRESWLCG